MNLNSNEIFYLIISLGSVIGSMLFSTQLHTLAKYLYGNLRKVLENDYQSFDRQRDEYYYRFVLGCGGFMLLFTILDISKLFFRENVDLSLIYFCLILLSVILLALWIKTFYSNRKPLLLFRYILSASEERKGLGNLDEKIRQLNEELRGGNWDEAKFQFSYILNRCNKILTDMPLRRTGEVDLQKYGFIFIDFKNQEKSLKLQELINEIRGLEEMKSPSIISSEAEERDLILEVRKKEKELEKKLQDWKITDWISFLRENLPWWLKLDCYIRGRGKKSPK